MIEKGGKEGAFGISYEKLQVFPSIITGASSIVIVIDNIYTGTIIERIVTMITI